MCFEEKHTSLPKKQHELLMLMTGEGDLRRTLEVAAGSVGGVGGWTSYRPIGLRLTIHVSMASPHSSFKSRAAD